MNHIINVELCHALPVVGIASARWICYGIPLVLANRIQNMLGCLFAIQCTLPQVGEKSETLPFKNQSLGNLVLCFKVLVTRISDFIAVCCCFTLFLFPVKSKNKGSFFVSIKGVFAIGAGKSQLLTGI